MAVDVLAVFHPVMLGATLDLALSGSSLTYRQVNSHIVVL